MVDSSTSSTSTQSLSGEGDLDSTEGHSQLLVGTLPLTEKDPPEKPEDKNQPPSSPTEKGGGSQSSTLPESLDKIEDTPTSPKSDKSPTGHTPENSRDFPPHTQDKSKKGTKGHPTMVVKDTPIKDPFSRF